MIKFGTNRIVIVRKKWVYKIPILFRGNRANKLEYQNYTTHENVVAKTIKKWYGLKQERLTDITIYKYQTTDVLPEHFDIYNNHFTHNRLQIGKDHKGEWKIFDAEDVKYYEKEVDYRVSRKRENNAISETQRK